MKEGLPFRLRNKIFTIFVFFTTVPILAFSYWTLQVLEEHSEGVVLESLQGLAKTKAQAIETFSQNRLANIEKIASFSNIITDVKVLTSTLKTTSPKKLQEKLPALEKEGGGLPQSVAEKRSEESTVEPDDDEESPLELADTRGLVLKDPEAQAALTSLKKTLTILLSDQREYEEMLIINPKGLVIASSFDGHEGKTARGIDYFENGLKATFFQPVFVSSITEKLTMVISTPIKDEAGNILGVFAARLNLDLFFAVVEDLSGLRKTGETIVAKEIAQEVVFMAPTRHDNKAALMRTIVMGSEELKPLQEAVRGGSGTGEVIDYRGIECLAAWEHIPSLDWGIMVKMDQSEAIQPYLEAQYKTLILTLVMLFAGVLLSLYISNALVRPIKQLQEAADRISKGDLDVKLTIYSKDEIGDLADSFGRMIASIKFLLEEKDRNQE